MKNVRSTNKPLIGFFPLFYNLAETGRAVLIAKQYVDNGGNAIFFSHGGEYEKIAKENGFKVIQVKPIYSEEFIEDLWKYSRLEKIGAPFSLPVLKDHVKSEINAYRKSDVKLIVTTNNFPCTISARIAKIPLISVTPKVIGKFIQYPEDAELKYTSLIPKTIKLKILNYFYTRSKLWSKPFDKLAKQYKIKRFKNSMDLVKGDYTFYTDFQELIKIKNSEIRSNEYYIGPIFLDKLFFKNNQKNEIEKDVANHLERPGKKILLTLGSSGTKELYQNILKSLNKTEFNVIAIYSSILNENELPKLNNNILLKKQVNSIQNLNKKADLVIMHGGQGTVYTAAYSGKPVIGFPMQLEQHQNLELLVKHGMAKIESRKNSNKQLFLDTIEEIFSNYSYYYKNAKKLANSLPKPQGEKNALKNILEIIKMEDI